MGSLEWVDEKAAVRMSYCGVLGSGWVGMWESGWEDEGDLPFHQPGCRSGVGTST